MIAILLGVVSGLIMGLSGAGGSIIAVPLLMWGMSWTLPEAVPVALLAVSLSAAVGTWAAWPSHTVRYRAALVIAGASLVTAPLGLHVAGIVSLNLLSLLFGCALLIAATRLLIQARNAPERIAISKVNKLISREPVNSPPCLLQPETGKLQWSRLCLAAIAFSGAVSGFFAGLLGVGGGFIIVPALRTVTNIPFHSAVATSLMAMAITSIYTTGFALISGTAIPWLVALPFMAGAVAGMLGGRKMAPRISGPRLQAAFALLMACVALGMLADVIAGYRFGM